MAGIEFYEDARERFNLYAEPEPNSGCWLWSGPLTNGGYGCLSRGRRTPVVRAHRLAWELYRGPIPVGLCVLHRCDVRTCVNPDHLFLGTRDDNNLDMSQKWRGRKSKTGLPFGVSVSKFTPEGRFCASYWAGKKHHVGTFNTVEEARLAAIAGKREYLNGRAR